MKQLLLIFIGGGFGSVARFGLGKLLNTHTFPYGTFLVNILGSFLIGCILGFFIKENSSSQNMLLLLATGFCGGFTTFSSFTHENLAMLKQGNFSIFLFYALSSLILGIAAVFLGIKLSRFF